MKQQVATMSTSAALLKRAITDEEITQYRRDGVVCLRDILTAEWIDTIRAGIDEQREQPGPYATVLQSERSYTMAEQVSSNFNEKLRRAVLQSGTGQIAQAMLEAPQVRLLHDNIFYKDAGDIIETPWHQDTANGCFDGMNMIRIWIPVDPVARQTAIEVVRASHLWNAFYVSGDLDAYKDQAVDLEASAYYFDHSPEPYAKVPTSRRTGIHSTSSATRCNPATLSRSISTCCTMPARVRPARPSVVRRRSFMAMTA